MQNRASIILSSTITMFYFAKAKSYSSLYLFLFFPCYVKIKRTQVTDRRKHPRFIFYKEGVSQILLQKAWLWISVGNVVEECRAFCRGKAPSGHSQKGQAYCRRDKILHLTLNPIFLCFFSGYQTFWTRLAQYYLFSMQFIMVLTLFQYLIYT